ncbi:phosphomevalonate kinase-like [Mizuhopecten yessoensis]|uniref:Phosphomevalonate kinase n=1 Tax=Mizuhopecten yessoensis TaxID=6573 RepID=A0A210QZC7_MIZYE|nr:phosphomevalonate kinase-like [Mizuhopecten yessoensis]XP_021346134.1 phosphomevalonate kinase-like [Mizuhopecten yessoensis]OWF54113.1 Phosphomevalonate kinase [Mizuhopecten yessoensis]
MLLKRNPGRIFAENVTYKLKEVMATRPKAVLVFSGKRKSGKDFITERLMERFGAEICGIIRLSGPLKQQYALEKSLDFARLLDSTSYKEQFRADMIRWGEDKRNQDPGFFCQVATSGDEAKKSVWIISDARRKTDIEYFKSNFPDITKTIRVVTSDSTRQSRGFVFTPGVDDAESECGLDNVDFDMEIINNGDDAVLEKSLQDIEHLLVSVKILQGER